MSDSVKRLVPGGKTTTTAKAYCDAWRKYAEPIAFYFGWSIHSFGPTYVRLVSKDYAHTQDLQLRFIELLLPVIQKATTCSHCSKPSSSEASTTPPTRAVLPPPSTVPNTRTSATREASSVPVKSSSRSTTSWSFDPLPPRPTPTPTPTPDPRQLVIPPLQGKEW